ncbi:hypothetical protein RSAG8_08213, partial [Rhizoctonia solani AG-8 WAC10335]
MSPPYSGFDERVQGSKLEVGREMTRHSQLTSISGMDIYSQILIMRGGYSMTAPLAKTLRSYLPTGVAHVPKDVLAKNFRFNASAFDHIPDRQLWMLPSAVPTRSVAEANPLSPAGTVSLPYTFVASKAPATNTTEGAVRAIDPRTFNISQTIAVAEITVAPGGIRGLQWHPTQPEWTFFLQDYQAWRYWPCPSHYWSLRREHHNTTLKYLEIFNSNIYEGIGLNQWFTLTFPIRSRLIYNSGTRQSLNCRRLRRL